MPLIELVVKLSLFGKDDEGNGLSGEDLIQNVGRLFMTLDKEGVDQDQDEEEEDQISKNLLGLQIDSQIQESLVEYNK